ncbi:hypothetical protein RI578_22795 [Streptomyces sp. BB1-1-1]|uniref:hypothetical protein n=1 Tax=Streptomyces sp. BB1-1-1 TaxID=3074430 RepID=UPI002877CE13|nr:hypothetical protein [Streptomyces sp. BB1-1-1]WND36939.1 hypothetical protein RI578_22795 [Streptomyces sp. BB1-1-1]
MTSNSRALLAELDRATAPTVQAIYDLRAVREQWGDLLAAIERPPAAEWPPREARGFLDQLAAADRTDDDLEPSAAARVGRLPLILREHPAPLNLDALDAAIAVERDLFDLADLLAAAIQRPIRTGRDPHGRFTRDHDDATNPARWHPPTHRDTGPAAASSAGSRAYGLHWAAVWLEGRVCGEDTDGDLFALLPPYLLEQAAQVAARARRTVERALSRDGRTTTLDDPCPWCRGQLVGRTRPGGEPVVTCSTGEGCGAPAILDHGRRTWRGAELVGLFGALDAARNRAEDSTP